MKTNCDKTWETWRHMQLFWLIASTLWKWYQLSSVLWISDGSVRMQGILSGHVNTKKKKKKMLAVFGVVDFWWNNDGYSIFA